MNSMKLMKIMKLGISPLGIFAILTILSQASFCNSLQAQSFVVHNLDAPNSEPTNVENNRHIATSFTTGSQPATLAGLVARFNFFSGEVFIYDNAASNRPGSSIGTFLSNPMDRGSNSELLFTPDGTISLSANTTYWTVFRATYSEPFWAASTTETSDAGWEIGDRHWRSSIDSSGTILGWAEAPANPGALQFGIIIPETSTYAIVGGMCLVGFVAFRRIRISKSS